MEAKADAAFSISVKTHISGFFAASAALFARQARAIERDHDLSAPDDVKTHLRSYAIGAVVGAASFLESAINEFYLDAVHGNRTAIPEDRDREILAATWEDVERYASILTKYDLALALTGRARFDKGTAPYQDANNVVNLRNALVHYKPEWSDALDKHQNLADRLDGRFAENSLVPKAGVEFFPHRCLGHGCAQWATRSALAFHGQFVERMNVPVRSVIGPPSLLDTE